VGLSVDVQERELLLVGDWVRGSVGGVRDVVVVGVRVKGKVTEKVGVLVREPGEGVNVSPGLSLRVAVRVLVPGVAVAVVTVGVRVKEEVSV